MSEVACREKEWWEHYPYHRIWCNDLCPLVPRFKYRKGDEWNPNNWYFHWLFFNVWTLENFSFGVDADIGPTNAHIGAILPYLRIMVGVKCFWNKYTMAFEDLTRRKPAIKRKDDDGPID